MQLNIVSTIISSDGVEASQHLWYAQSEDFPIAAQGDTAGEAAERLREAIRDHLVEETVEQEAY